jgi:hypothetical protein
MDSFIKHWLGKRVDYDKVFLYQCVDLILQYISEVYGIHSGVSGNAIDYWTNTSPALFKAFFKMPTNTPPQRGDIVVYKPTIGNKYGHILVAVNGQTALEQNGYSGDGDGEGGDEVRYASINLGRIAGILRPKEDLMSEIDFNLALEQADAQWGWGTRTQERDDILKRDIVGRETNEAIFFMYNHQWGTSWRTYRDMLQQFWNDWHDKIASGNLSDDDEQEIKAAMAKLDEAKAELQKGLDD